MAPHGTTQSTAIMSVFRSATSDPLTRRPLPPVEFLSIPKRKRPGMRPGRAFVASEARGYFFSGAAIGAALGASAGVAAASAFGSGTGLSDRVRR